VKARTSWVTSYFSSTDEDRKENGPIETGKTPADVRQEPYNLPEGFTWCEVDMRDGQEAKEVYDLLNQNYVEDDDNMFRFDYSPAFLEWALTPPGSQKDFIVGIRVDPSAAAVTKGKSRRKLVGFITGVPVQMRVSDKVMPMVEINFLCVLKKLRSKRLAPVLIKEITRRVNLTGVSPYGMSNFSSHRVYMHVSCALLS
jgi:glycylpeptide N-tetradecanoyltransferase